MGKNKRSRRREVSNLEDAIEAQGQLPVSQPVEPAVPTNPNPAPRSLPLSLADIRTEALKAHSDVAHTIADLEAWAAEIASTIAFLKARGR
jgi:hypothetical protein